MRALLLALLLAAPAGAQVLPGGPGQADNQENFEFILRRVRKLEAAARTATTAAAASSSSSGSTICPSVIYLNAAQTASIGCSQWTMEGTSGGDIRLLSSGDLRFTIGGTEVMRLDAAGNLGIKTASPAYDLDVSGTGHFSAGVVDGLLAAGSLSGDGSALTALSASALASGTVPNARLASSSVTLQANTFNGASQLVQTTSGGLYPALDGSLILRVSSVSVGSVNLSAAASNVVWGGTVTSNASQFSGTGTGTSPLTLLSSSVTLQGNAFNGNSQLVQTTAAGKYPALDGSLITNISGSGVSAGTITANASQFSGTGAGSSPLTLLSSSVTLKGNTNVALLNSSQTFSGQDTFRGQVTVSTGLTVSGNVGIGTTAPAYQLEVFGTVYAHGAFWIDGPADGSVTLFADSSNNIGIGALSTGPKLDVSGSASFGDKTAAQLRALAPTKVKEMFHNSSDGYQLYVGTGTGTGQWAAMGRPTVGP